MLFNFKKIVIVLIALVNVKNINCSQTEFKIRNENPKPKVKTNLNQMLDPYMPRVLHDIVNDYISVGTDDKSMTEGYMDNDLPINTTRNVFNSTTSKISTNNIFNRSISEISIRHGYITIEYNDGQKVVTKIVKGGPSLPSILKDNKFAFCLTVSPKFNITLIRDLNNIDQNLFVLDTSGHYYCISNIHPLRNGKIAILSSTKLQIWEEQDGNWTHKDCDGIYGSSNDIIELPNENIAIYDVCAHKIKIIQDNSKELKEIKCIEDCDYLKEMSNGKLITYSKFPKPIEIHYNKETYILPNTRTIIDIRELTPDTIVTLSPEITKVWKFDKSEWKNISEYKYYSNQKYLLNQQNNETDNLYKLPPENQNIFVNSEIKNTTQYNNLFNLAVYSVLIYLIYYHFFKVKVYA